jgi:hypothetical protein
VTAAVVAVLTDPLTTWVSVGAALFGAALLCVGYIGMVRHRAASSGEER